MRTRIYNKMTSFEIEDYLKRGGDTIFLGIGVVECHGFMPVDVETILPEAKALLLAEKADGLALVNLPYFYPGGTIISPATIRLSIRDCMEYLNQICYSLITQGFKKIFLVSGHGPAYLYIDAFIRDFFEETLIHPCHISNTIGKPFMFFVDDDEGDEKKDKKPPFDPEMFKMMLYQCYGAYKIMGQMEFLPVDPDAKEPEAPLMETNEALADFSKFCYKYGGVCSQVYEDPSMHSGGMIFKSEEERLEICTIGEQALREEIDKFPIEKYAAALGKYQEYVKRVAEKNPHIVRNYRKF